MFRNGIWLRYDLKIHMFCSCYLTADKNLRHTTVQYNVWPWPPLPLSLSAKKKHANLSSKEVLWHGGRPPSPSASAAGEFKLCTLQPIAATQSQTILFRLSMSRHVWVLSRDGAKKCVMGLGWALIPDKKSNNKFQVERWKTHYCVSSEVYCGFWQ